MDENAAVGRPAPPSGPLVMTRRRRRIWNLFDFAAGGRGLEVGPLHRPIVGRDEADVRYVDVTDRARLLEHYADDPVVMAGGIPEIDYWLIQDDGRTLSLAEAVSAGAPYGWVMASHVIEHVPDLIGWLGEVAEVMDDGAALVLVVPDRRYCFDVHRPPTTVGQLIAAHLDGDTRPSTRAVYDYYASSVDSDEKALWRGEYPVLGQRIHSLSEAGQHVERTVAGEYVDCHVWLFSPGSFVRQMQELRITGLSSWVVETVEQTRRDDLEFRVVMRRLPRDVDPTGAGVAATYDEVQPTGDLPDWLGESPGQVRVHRLEKRIARLEERIAQRARQLDRQRRLVGDRDERISELERSAREIPARAGLRRVRALVRRGLRTSRPGPRED